jgi:hypothetical protein
LRDIVADAAVPTCRGIAQHAILVEQRNGDAVDLRFDHDPDWFVRQQPLQPAVKVGDFRFRVGVIEAEHRRPMRHLRKRLQRRAADALRRRFGRGELRVLVLQIDELAIKGVVFAIADRRRRLLIVAAVVLCDLPAQFGDALLSGACLIRHAASYKRLPLRQRRSVA